MEFLFISLDHHKHFFRSLELLPKLLSCVECCNNLTVENDEFTGPQYKSHMLNRLCSVRWNTRCLLPLITTLRDVTLAASELQFIIDKVQTSMVSAPYTELPPLVYQLLLYATKGHRKKIIAGIIKHFDDQDERVGIDAGNDQDSLDILSAPPEDLWQAEGTCLLHVVYAIKHDLELGKALNQYLKALKHYTPFSVALGLSFSQLSRFTDQVLGCLKTGIVKNLKTKKLWDSSKFVQGTFSDPVNINSVLGAVIIRSDRGWDYVTQGLVSLAFLLLDIPDAPDEPSVAAVGVSVLEQCYKLHPQCKSAVLTQLLHRMVTSTPLSSNKHSALLGTISRRSLQLMLSESNKVFHIP